MTDECPRFENKNKKCTLYSFEYMEKLKKIGVMSIKMRQKEANNTESSLFVIQSEKDTERRITYESH
jgi:hypothetical protein